MSDLYDPKLSSILTPEEIEKFIKPELPEEKNVDESSDGEEKKELTEEEKREQAIQELKKSHIKFKPVKQSGNKTVNQFGVNYKKERKRKNKEQRKSRKKNR